MLHVYELARTQVQLQLQSRLQWRASFLIELLTTALWMLVYLGFWNVIFNRLGHFQGWTFASIVVFVGFQELFFGFSQSLFKGAQLYYYFIHSGRLELFLTRPIDPRLSAIANNIDPYQMMRSAVMFTVFMVAAARLGFHFSLPYLLGGMVLALLAAIAKALFALCVNYVAFWWDNVDALHELLGAFDHFLRVPLTVMPSALQLFFTLVLPYTFAATFPALLSGGTVSAGQALLPLLALAGSITGLFLLQTVLWRLGLKRYDGRGG